MARATSRVGRKAAGISAFAIVAAGCSGSDTSAICDPVRTEPLAVDWAIHVLDDEGLSYVSDPPTSGPHIAWDAPPVLDRTLSRAEQVGILEAGDVLLQYRANDIDAAEVQALVAALPARAHVAPNPDLPAAVVLTAFLTKQECSAIDLGSVEDFTDDHAGERVDR